MRRDVIVSNLNAKETNALYLLHHRAISSLRIVVADTQAPVTMFLYHLGHQTVLTWGDMPRLATFRLMSVLRDGLHEREHRVLAVNRVFVYNAPMTCRDDRRSISMLVKWLMWCRGWFQVTMFTAWSGEHREVVAGARSILGWHVNERTVARARKACLHVCLRVRCAMAS
jgi:hypothetical protein